MDLKAELARERRGRLAAERLLELRQHELAQANARLGKHAIKLSEEIIEKREEAAHLRDVTEEVRHELAMAQDEIAIAKRRLWGSLETVQDGFAVFDNGHRLIIANSAYFSVFDGMDAVRPGITYEEIIAIMVEEGIADPGDLTGAEWRDMMMDRWYRPQPDPVTIRLWDGAYIKLVDRRGEDGDTASLALNITEAIRTEQKLKKAGEKAMAASRAKSAFLARMSHELRTPMNGVVGMADILAESDLNEEQRQFVETIRSSGEALLLLINDVLDFSKMEAERLKLVPVKFDLAELLEGVMRLFRPALEPRQVELGLDYPAGLPHLFVADQGRIRQILTNLIGNAAKFTERGHVRVAVSAQVAEGGRADMSILVEDTGIGIGADKLEHIFGEFNQVEDATNRKFEGTGLGLAICRQLAELMGGCIAVESTVGVGSRFTLKLPLPVAEIAAGRAAIDEPARARAEIAAPDRRLRVLAAEDNRTNRLVFEKLVKSLDIDLRFAENGRDAVEAWREFRPDLIFMDISMPEMDGKEATAAIRAQEAASGVPPVRIVALTAHAMSGDCDDILAAGLDGYLTKPLKKQPIFDEINSTKPRAPAPNTKAGADSKAVQQIWNGLTREPGPRTLAGLAEKPGGERLTL